MKTERKEIIHQLALAAMKQMFMSFAYCSGAIFAFFVAIVVLSHLTTPSKFMVYGFMPFMISTIFSVMVYLIYDAVKTSRKRGGDKNK